MTVEKKAGKDKVQHSHCQNCMKTVCLVPDDPPQSCLVTHCQSDCGATYHECKEQEHKQLCPNQRVPCINQVYGCTVVLSRNQMGKHLRICPASVIQCCAQWNRWPAYCKETYSKVPFMRENMHARYGQLDVAFALRDQRALTKAYKAPKRVRRALRNKLTKIYPPVPLTSNVGSVSDVESTDASVLSDEDMEAPWEISKYPPGLQCTIMHELFKVTESKAAILAGGDADNQNLMNGLVNNAEKPLHVDVEGTGAAGPASQISSGGSSADVSSFDRSDTQSPLMSPMSNSVLNTKDDFISRESSSDREAAGDSIAHVPKAPPPPQLKHLLGLNVSIEYVSKYQSKPASMYTFWCAQNFRRDEYAWHHKNVHHDIQAGLDGWMEYRCPLAQYGCAFTVRRLFPKCKTNKVYYSELIEGFGVKSDPVSETAFPAEFSNQTEFSRTKSPTPEVLTSNDYNTEIIIRPRSDQMGQSHDSRVDMLSSLPDELLLTILRYLDGFALNNLALTCHRMRSLCCNLLENKGIVVLQWDKVPATEGKVHWDVALKVSFRLLCNIN